MDARATTAGLSGRAREALARRFGVDARALAALRISLGLLLLADLALRSRTLVVFYTDYGVLPRAALRRRYPGLSGLSLHAVSGEAWVQAALFLLAAVVAVALLLGYRTTLATAVSLLLLASLHARNPLVLNAGDAILRRLLLWGVFLPLGGRWSFDARRDGAAGSRVASLASAALLVQVVLVYAVNAAFKLRSDVWLRGEAIRYVFALDRLTVLLGDALAGHPELLALLDRLWLAMVVGSVLLVALTGRARAAFAALFVGAHLGMALTLRLGLFPLVSVAALLPFLPGAVWDGLERRTAGLRRSLDGLPAGDDPDRFGPRDRLAVRGRLAPLGLRGRLRRRGLPGGADRATGGTGGAARAAEAVGRWKRRLATLVVAGLLAAVLAWNAATLGYADLPDGATRVADPADYQWDMFANPARTDSWYVAPGTTASGRRVDALALSELRWDRPPDAADAYPTHRWYVYLTDLRGRQNAGLRPHLAGYLCRRWNDRRADDLASVSVVVVEEPTRFDGPERTRRVELLTRPCPGG